jgi:hypothetical protein
VRNIRRNDVFHRSSDICYSHHDNNDRASNSDKRVLYRLAQALHIRERTNGVVHRKNDICYIAHCNNDHANNLPGHNSGNSRNPYGHNQSNDDGLLKQSLPHPGIRPRKQTQKSVSSSLPPELIL